MSGPIHRRENLANQSRLRLADVLERQPANHQRMFNYAMELISRNNKTINNEIVAKAALRRLARAGRTWTNRPSSIWITDNNSNANSNSNSMNNNQAWAAWRAQYADQDALNAAAAAAAARAPNYSKASGALKKWLAARPHTIYQNVVQIKLPKNAEDPVSYKNFKAGNEAVMVVKKRLLSNGAMRSRRTFYNKNTIERLAQGKKWRTILRMKGSDAVFKDPINRRTVYRRDLMNVKFV
jgi:hypothetical protein